jgi:hypothetical protein
MRLALRMTDRPVSLSDLFSSPSLLGALLTDDVGTLDDRQLSRWTLAQRRSAIRSFATLMRPELLQMTGVDPHVQLDKALRNVAERVAGGYRPTGGAPRHRGGYAPTTRRFEP